jgi:hypothetical protein
MVPQPYALARGEGRGVWFLDSLLIVKATGEQTGGAFGLIDNVMPPGDSPYRTRMCIFRSSLAHAASSHRPVRGANPFA